jgi:acyl dehydratase
MMTDNFGEAYLAGGEIAVSFIKPVRPGDAIRARGVVQEIRVEGAKQRLTCEVWLENQVGEKTTAGNASVSLSKEAGEGEA